MCLHSDWQSNKKYIRLQKIIKQWHFFDAALGEHCNEIEAKSELNNFFKVLQSCRPDRKLNLGFRTGYYSFLINLLPLQKALENQKYALACHELETLFAYEPILQERIYCNLWLLYEKYLK